MQTYPAVEQNKNIKWSESPWNQFQSGRMKRVYATYQSLVTSRLVEVEVEVFKYRQFLILKI